MIDAKVLQFILAKGAGDAALKKFLEYINKNGIESVSELLKTPQEIVYNLNIKEDVASNIINTENEAMILSDNLKKDEITLLTNIDKDYPSKKLKVLEKDASPVLFVKGNKDLLSMKSIGFCGSRKASEKGIDITQNCSKQLVEKDYCIISGYAHGVDMAAHISALKNGGKTIFVLVDGILRFTEKKEIKEYLSSSNHLIVSQFPPNITWIGHNAMRRNLTIIGLSDAMILVESGITGGTFAAGEETLKVKRPLFVIDFAKPGPSAEANPYFIKKGGISIRGKKGVPNLSELIKITSSEPSTVGKEEKTFGEQLSLFQFGDIKIEESDE